jgi:hypothetical protein
MAAPGFIGEAIGVRWPGGNPKPDIIPLQFTTLAFMKSGMSQGDDMQVDTDRERDFAAMRPRRDPGN